LTASIRAAIFPDIVVGIPVGNVLVTKGNVVTRVGVSIELTGVLRVYGC
jgi:hypothetical protein